VDPSFCTFRGRQPSPLPMFRSSAARRTSCKYRPLSNPNLVNTLTLTLDDLGNTECFYLSSLDTHLMSSVQLVHATRDGDNLVAYMARVSNPNNQDNTETSDRLIKYLVKHKHWSPFEMVNMCVEISTTRSIAAQILRHRSFSFQEFSQRYAQVTEPIAAPELRRQDTTNRQNSIDDLDPFEVRHYQTRLQHHFRQSMDLYESMLNAGVAKECAREVLPLCTPSKLYMNGSLRSWIHYCDLRTANGTQHEHKIIADQCQKLICEQFPLVAAGAWSCVS